MTTPSRNPATDLGEQLINIKRRVATVESCTGGGIAQMITAIPGSSQWFERGFVTYGNAAKTEMVGVARELIQRHGAVSVEVATAMAEGGIRFSRADYCLAVTGVAGPDGGTATNPVGTVCFAWAARDAQQKETLSARQHFTGNRHNIREQSVAYALAGLLDFIGA